MCNVAFSPRYGLSCPLLLAVRIVVDGRTTFSVAKAYGVATTTRVTGAATTLVAPDRLFQLSAVSSKSVTVTVLAGGEVTSADLRLVTAEAKVGGDAEFRAKCLRIMKKELPRTTTLQLLYPSDAYIASVSGGSSGSGKASRGGGASGRPEAAISPLSHAGDPVGKVFVGLSTQQVSSVA